MVKTKSLLDYLVKKANGQQGQDQNENKTGNIIIKDGDQTQSQKQGFHH